MNRDEKLLYWPLENSLFFFFISVYLNRGIVGIAECLLGSRGEFWIYFIVFTSVMLHVWLWFIYKEWLLN